MKLLILLLLLTSCSTMKCMAPSQSFFGLDGKAYSSCKAFIQYEKECKYHGGVKYGNALSGSCIDGSVIERRY